MNYLVTGGAGFIGSHIAEALLERGDKVRVFDDFSRGLECNIANGVEVIRGSITEPEEITQALQGVDAVFHCAALSSVELSLHKPEETLDVNLKGTLNVVRAAAKAGISRLVFSSSAAIYGDQLTMPLNETMNPNPESPYALEKYASEEYCKIASRVWGLETVCLRYFNVYGPRAAKEGAYVNVIPIFLRQRAENKPFTITGDGAHTRDYVYIDDVVHANILAMASQKIGGGESINIGSGIAMSVNEIARQIGGSTINIAPRIEQAHAQADITRAKELLDWKPQVKFDEGIKKTIMWFEQMQNVK